MLFIISAVSAQDYKKLQIAYLANKFEDARNELDKVLADPKAANSAEGVLWKARVYSSLFADSALRTKYPSAGQIAFDAFTNYMTMDTSAKTLKAAGLGVVNNLYVTNLNEGLAFFQKQMWDSAYEYLRRSYQMGEYITQKNWKNNNQTFDTISVTYAGFAAQNANRKQDALKYYSKLADARVGGKDYQNVYRYILLNYLDAKDSENFNKYLATANQLYPDEKSLWGRFQSEYMSKNASVQQILEKYKADDAAGSLSEEDYATYGQTFASPSKGDAKVDSLQEMEFRKTAAEAFKKAFAKSPNGLYAFNTGLMYYIQWDALGERYSNYKGTSPALKAKRDEIEKMQLALFDPAVEWFEKGYTVLKAKTDRDRNENNTLNKTVDFLANLYAWRREKTKGSKNPKDYDVYDAKYKQYDVEHNKYK